MSTFGIDGLSSGLDTTSIINQLLALERQPAVRLESRISSNTKAIAALTAISAKFSTVDAAAKALTDTSTSFVPRKAASSGSHVTATADAGAPLGSTTFTVEQLAASHREITASTVADANTVVATVATQISVTTGTGTTAIDVAAGATLADVAAAIDASGSGIDAQVVDTGGGLKLQLSAATSGVDGVFSADLSGLDQTAFASGSAATATLVQGQDAQIRVGDAGQPGSYLVDSATNTFSGVLEGVTFTVSAVSADPVTVSVAEDPAALAGKVKSFVDAVNAALGELDKQLSTGISGGTPGALPADGPMRSLRDRLLAAVTYGVPGSALGSGGLAGIQSTREGMLTFDEAAFTDALTADPTEVEKLFRSADPDVPAIADRVVALATDATRSGDGIIASATASRESQNTTFTSQIEAIDRRIELRRATMQRQWAAVEVAMGAMQAQQSWLSSQIGVLNANNTASR